MQAQPHVHSRAATARPWWILLLLGDLAALYLFVLAGQMDHDLLPGANPLWYTLTRGWPFLAVWLVVGWLAGAFRLPDEAAGWPLLRTMGARALHGWLIAAPLGVVLRALVLGRSVVPVLFFLTTLGFGALFLLAWRLLFGLVYRIRPAGGS
jgi:hypothetical protein